MKFGKRRKDAEPVDESAPVSAPPAAEPVPVKWAVADTEPVPAEPIAEPEREQDTVIDAEAVELPVEEAVAEAPAPPAAAPYVPPPPPPMPYPVAEQPVFVASSGNDGGGVTPLSETGPAYASGHAAGHAAGTSPSWPEPVMQLATERPEVVVGAAFAGGLLFAAILRRLGN